MRQNVASPVAAVSTPLRELDHGRVDVVDWLSAMLFLAEAPFAKKLALAFALADARAHDTLDARQLLTLFRAMALGTR